jgi:hypothetical protein
MFTHGHYATQHSVAWLHCAPPQERGQTHVLRDRYALPTRCYCPTKTSLHGTFTARRNLCCLSGQAFAYDLAQCGMLPARELQDAVQSDDEPNVMGSAENGDQLRPDA